MQDILKRDNQQKKLKFFMILKLFFYASKKCKNNALNITFQLKNLVLRFNPKIKSINHKKSKRKVSNMDKYFISSQEI